jgi:hypothetical protein
MKNTMASRTLRLYFASVFASLLLVCVSSREAVQRADRTMSVTASTEALANDSITTCVDIASSGADITHVFVASECAESPSDFFITVDGVAAIELHTNGGPCQDFPRDVWFQLKDKQDMAFVCVTVPGDCPEGTQVYAKAGDECIVGTMP